MPSNLSAESTAGKKFFRSHLLQWYDANKRDLPWRQDRDPYRVWLSEIMLQQTRVAAVVDHYHRFLRRFPTVKKLAAARQALVLAAWSGLGYYRRARMLHAAAKRIVRNRGCEFPRTAKDLRDLPGIGRYTAAAIASIAFDEPVAVVDGNVERVLGRIFEKELAQEEFWQAAETLLDPRRPGDFNQAIMELGATVCLPRQPLCQKCPVVRACETRGENKKAAKGVRQTKREIYYALNCRNGSVFLVRRPQDASQMPGMWELPEIPKSTGHGEGWLTLRHSITTTDYTVLVSQGASPETISGRWIAKSRLPAIPLTGLARKILRATQIF